MMGIFYILIVVEVLQLYSITKNSSNLILKMNRFYYMQMILKKSKLVKLKKNESLGILLRT